MPRNIHPNQRSGKKGFLTYFGKGGWQHLLRYLATWVLALVIPFLALEKEAEIAYQAAERLSRRSQLQHARVVLGDAFIFLRDFLPDSCTQAVHVYFPDPWPKKRHHKHRIMRAEFLEQVRRVAIPEAVLYFGTDHEDYNRETQELFSATPWLEMLNPNAEPTEGIQTNFEIKYRKVGKPVYRCVLKVNKE